jgi:phosphodiesterase/alkaline phosphatase D-like protein
MQRRQQSTKVNPRSRLLRFGRGLLIGILMMGLLWGSVPIVNAATTVSFSGGELVGNPTDTSIAINVVPDEDIEYIYDYGTSSGSLTLSAGPFLATGGQPHEIVINGLLPNTQYFYQMRYHAPGEGDWVIRDEHSFWTQRAKGESFIFTITADTHNARPTSLSFTQSMQNVADEHPDFHIDIGDTQFAEFTRDSNIQNNVNGAYLEYRAPTHFGAFGHSVPVFLSAGNHEEEEGWNLDDANSRGLANIQARKAYNPTPIDDGFYSANTDPLADIDEFLYGDEYRENYYAWEWGDALFVVIDPFQYTMVLPYPIIAGEEGDESTTTDDQWVWTLGEEQYLWLKDTLESSNAKYKFMFSHQMVGGIPDNSVSGTAGYVRGGAEAAGYFEWGGRNFNGSEGFAANRSGWYAPIHQLMVENGVSAYFHGHDHQFVYEKRDGIVYQLVPSPSMSGTGFGGIYAEGTYADYETIEILPNAGHLQITVSPEIATVDYIGTNGSNNYTYTIEPNETPPGILGDVNGDLAADSTDALIILTGDAGLDITKYCPVNCGDVNGDGVVNSNDAAILLSFNAGMTVPYPVGTVGCPESATCAGCSP